jgi:hypothetical protein
MLIRALNQHLKGWGNYFRFGYASNAFDQINHYSSLTTHNYSLLFTPLYSLSALAVVLRSGYSSVILSSIGRHEGQSFRRDARIAHFGDTQKTTL